MEHILKLKKSVGLSPEKAAKGQKSVPASRNNKAGSTTQHIRSSDHVDDTVGLGIDRDDTELAASVKPESPGAANTREGTIDAPAGTFETIIEPDEHHSGGGPQSDNEDTMSGEETADEALAAEPQIKNEDDDFVIPVVDDLISPMMFPKRTQQPRQAKAKRKMVYDYASDDDSVLWYDPRDNISATVGRTPSPPLAASLGIEEVIAVSSHGRSDENVTPNVSENVSGADDIDEFSRDGAYRKQLQSNASSQLGTSRKRAKMTSKHGEM
ncbi:hypothetical protein AC578_9197 [Pseudocercospora eumusae]|uniref:Uncharacterized protein n=1 Tax=Pseudocercospora eumusae TaxID=321146 RepID=A0A139HVD6_9PEZI|nr:hypothetical protein AC578_9197 [Pseudocercospora eumusae]